MTDIGFQPPSVVPLALLVVLGGLVVSLLVTLWWRERFDGYRIVPEAELKIQNLSG